MAQATIPVDLFNPGQVFACLGLLEMAERLLGEAAGHFDWSDQANVHFMVRAAGDRCPLEAALHFLHGAEVSSALPALSNLSTQPWQVPVCRDPWHGSYPCPPPETPATLAAILRQGDQAITLAHWGDNVATGRDNTKFWAGAGGYPGAALARDSIAQLRKATVAELLPDPLNWSKPQSSSFRFDWRRDYIPLEIGFSLNAHSSGRFEPAGYPLVELLATIGLGNSRPKKLNKLSYLYGVITSGVKIIHCRRPTSAPRSEGWPFLSPRAVSR